MLTIKTFESSSSGNLHLITSPTKRLLIECGLSFKKIKQYLDFDLDISGCLLSHYHADHSKSAKKIMRAGIDLYCSKETAENMRLDSHRLKIVRMDTIYIVDGFRVLPFQANHDTPGALGYLIDVSTFSLVTSTLVILPPFLKYSDIALLINVLSGLNAAVFFIRPLRFILITPGFDECCRLFRPVDCLHYS